MMTARIEEEEKNLTGMEKKAFNAEVLLGLVIVTIISVSCFYYIKIYGKKERDAQLQTEINS